MELWIPITIAAAFSQNVRSALQKHLKGVLSTSGATLARFVYAAPLAVLYAVGLHMAGFELPSPNPTFTIYAMIGGLSQILATALLVSLFSHRNFAVGTAYSKSEALQTAVFGVVILGESISSGAAFGIVVSLAGVMAISVGSGQVSLSTLIAGLTQRTAVVGLASGAFFGVSAVTYRAASLGLDGGEVVMRAAFTLAFATVFQTIVMSIYMRLREPGEFTNTLRAWRVAALVGLSGMIASACWFTAMTMQNAAYVRALGQIELVFTFIVSYFVFRERSTKLEAIGIALVIAGILLLLLLGGGGARG
jgi:drug/metabolite transporter (DMT)-like permease